MGPRTGATAGFPHASLLRLLARKRRVVQHAIGQRRRERTREREQRLHHPEIRRLRLRLLDDGEV